MDSRKIAKELESYAIDLRREFHMHPEMPLEEKWTSERIRKELDALDIAYEVAGQYNVIAKLVCGDGTGKKLAIRADIDALPIQEATDVPFKSLNDGFMHACGHDAHTAVLLTTAKAIKENCDEFNGTFYFVFQQALHSNGACEPGTVELTAGPRYSGAECFFIDIEGRGGHGSRPDKCVDPVRIAVKVYDAITNIPVYSHSMLDTCVVSVCMLSAGNRFNIYPDKAHLEGTIRYYKDGDGDNILATLKEYAEKTAEMYGGKAVVTHHHAAKYPCFNHAAQIEKARVIAEKLGLKMADGRDPESASDNFAEFVHEWPGFYMFMGTADYSKEDTSPEVHTPNFYLNEDALHHGIAFFLAYAHDLLGK